MKNHNSRLMAIAIAVAALFVGEESQADLNTVTDQSYSGAGMYAQAAAYGSSGGWTMARYYLYGSPLLCWKISQGRAGGNWTYYPSSSGTTEESAYVLAEEYWNGSSWDWVCSHVNEDGVSSHYAASEVKE